MHSGGLHMQSMGGLAHAGRQELCDCVLQRPGASQHSVWCAGCSTLVWMAASHLSQMLLLLVTSGSVCLSRQPNSMLHTCISWLCIDCQL